jgi:thymidylate synthase (FAD)
MINYAEQNVVYVDHMGDDKTVVNAARVSFDADTNTGFDPERDTKLIQYLAKHNHWSPFAHTSIQIKVKTSIFVARQLVKHQVGGVWNEVSRRYVSDAPEYFAPLSWRGKPVNAKQGSTGFLDDEDQEASDVILHNAYEAANTAYQELLGLGVAPEQARMVLPIGSMTEWYWTGSLVFFARVCALRLDSHAQGETSELVGGIDRIIAPLFPVSWAALRE